MADQTTGKTNGIDTAGLKETMKAVSEDPSKGLVRFQVTTEWKGQCKMFSQVKSFDIGGEEVERSHTLLVDEPLQLLGENSAPNPQEVLMAAFNSCMMVGYTTGAAMKGITLEKLEIRCEGQLDLRGFLGLDSTVKPGYETISYTVRIKGNGTPEQFRQIHETVMATSPNRWNMANPIQLNGELMVE